MTSVFVAIAKTESCDTYVWAYNKEPSVASVIRRIWEIEQAEDLEWYEDTTSVTITKVKVE